MLQIPFDTIDRDILVEIDPVTELGGPPDPTIFPVVMTFSLTRALAPGPTFHAATWQVNLKAAPKKFYAVCAIGTGTPVGQLARGVWTPYAQPSAGTETPLIEGEPFRVY